MCIYTQTMSIVSIFVLKDVDVLKIVNNVLYVFSDLLRSGSDS